MSVESRPQKDGGIAQAWAMWPEGALVPNISDVLRARGTRSGNRHCPAMRMKAGISMVFIC